MKSITFPGGVELFIGTRVEILALPVAPKKFGFATDVKRFYLADDTSWNGSPIPFGQPSTGVDVGAFDFEDDSGYGAAHLSNKTLHNIVIGYFKNLEDEGGFRYDNVGKYLEVYQDLLWRKIQALTFEEEEDIQLWSKYTPQVDGYGWEIIPNHKIDVGALSAELNITGGTF